MNENLKLTHTCRAFDDKEINVIQFYHPLTVIVGHNGSGKTVRPISAYRSEPSD